MHQTSEVSDLWSCVRAASTSGSCFFEIERSDCERKVFGAGLGGVFCIFEQIECHLLRVFGVNGGTSYFVDVIDQRWPHVYFVPRNAFFPYQEFVDVGHGVISSATVVSVEIAQTFSAVDLPIGAEGDRLIDLMIADDNPDRRLRLGIKRVQSIH